MPLYPAVDLLPGLSARRTCYTSPPMNICSRHIASRHHTSRVSSSNPSPNRAANGFRDDHHVYTNAGLQPTHCIGLVGASAWFRPGRGITPTPGRRKKIPSTRSLLAPRAAAPATGLAVRHAHASIGGEGGQDRDLFRASATGTRRRGRRSGTLSNETGR